MMLGIYCTTKEEVEAEHKEIARFLDKENFIQCVEDDDNRSGKRKRVAVELIKILNESTGTSLRKFYIEGGFQKGKASKILNQLNVLLTTFSQQHFIDPPIQIFPRRKGSATIFCHFACVKKPDEKSGKEYNKAYSENIITLKEAKMRGELEAQKASQETEQQETLFPSIQSNNILTDKSEITFSKLADNLRNIDLKILPLVRKLNGLQEDLIHEAHQDLINQSLYRIDLSTDKLIGMFHEKECMASIVNNLPEPSINVEVADDFSKLSYICSPEEALEVNSPELFWDCHCDQREKDKDLYGFRCPLTDHSLYSKVKPRFYNGYVQIHYRGLRFYWRRGKELWPPSVDTYGMMNDLVGEGIFDKPGLSVLDIGSGTGLLGITIALHNPNIIKIDLSDWLLTPLLYGLVNWEINKQPGRDVKVKGRLDFLTCGSHGHKEPYDIVVCNPPYLPLLSEHKDLGLESSVAGTELLEHVIKNSRTLGKNIYIQFSDLALEEAQIAAKEASVNLKQVGTERKDTPFRLRTTWGKEGYIQMLKKRGLKDDLNMRHRYYHTVRTYYIEQ